MLFFFSKLLSTEYAWHLGVILETLGDEGSVGPEKWQILKNGDISSILFC